MRWPRSVVVIAALAKSGTGVGGRQGSACATAASTRSGSAAVIELAGGIGHLSIVRRDVSARDDLAPHGEVARDRRGIIARRAADRGEPLAPELFGRVR